MNKWYIIQVDFEFLSDIDMRMHTREYTIKKTEAMRVSRCQLPQIKNHLNYQGIAYDIVPTTYYKSALHKRFNLNRGQ